MGGKVQKESLPPLDKLKISAASTANGVQSLPEQPLAKEKPQQDGRRGAAKSLQSCPTLCDPIDGSPPGSPIPGILQARTLEWVAISFSNDESEK